MKKKPPVWKHDQKVSPKNIEGYLNVIKDRLQDLIKEERKKIDHLVGVRDGVKKR